MSRKAFALTLSVICIIAAAVFLVADPFYIWVPKDSSVLGDFQAHIVTFERMRQMVLQESTIASMFAADDLNKNLSPGRRDEYQKLFAQLPTGIVVTTHLGSVRFVVATGGLLSIRPEWIKGIEFLPSTPSDWGKIVDNLSNPASLTPGNIYLRPIHGKWFIFLQKTE